MEDIPRKSWFIVQQHIRAQCAFCVQALTEFGIKQNQPEIMRKTENSFSLFEISLVLEWCFDVLILAFDQFITEDFNMERDPDAVAAIASTSWPGRCSERPPSGSSPSSAESSLPQSKNASLRTLEARF